jgi:hypothetical protein
MNDIAVASRKITRGLPKAKRFVIEYLENGELNRLS